MIKSLKSGSRLVDELTCRWLTPNDIRSAQKEHYLSAFRLWHSVWGETMKQISGLHFLPSDNFSKQTEVPAIFHGDRCVALLGLRRVEYDNEIIETDSAFQGWPSAAIDELFADGKKLFICSNVTVDPEYRGDLGDKQSLKSMISALAILRLINSDCDVLAGQMRVNKNMVRIANEFNAKTIAKDVLYHGFTVDLVAFYRRQMNSLQMFKEQPVAWRLWNERIDSREESQKAA